MSAPGKRAALSIFSGAGGLDLGISRAGFSTVAAVEAEKYACEALRRNQGAELEGSDHPYLDGASVYETDIRELEPADVLGAAGLTRGECALLVGGPPCVTFSVAGRRAGLHHETGRLYAEFARFLDAALPEAFIFENVKGLLTAEGADGEPGGAFRMILEALASPGYALTWRLVDAADYGVPQHRHRVIVLGRRGTTPLEFPSPTHGDPAKLGLLAEAGLLAPWRTVRDAIGDLPPAAPYGAEPEVSNHVARRYSDSVVQSFVETPPGKRNPRYRRDRLLWDAPAKAIRAQGKPKADGSGQKNSSHQNLHPESHRQLTVRECARIQTFPDWYWLPDTFVNGYRLVGDAVPPALAETAARCVVDQLEATSVDELARAA